MEVIKEDRKNRQLIFIFNYGYQESVRSLRTEQRESSFEQLRAMVYTKVTYSLTP